MRPARLARRDHKGAELGRLGDSNELAQSDGITNYAPNNGFQPTPAGAIVDRRG
jgi:hypothetical protein